MSAPESAFSQSTAGPRQPPTGRKFPCPACGARLDFDPSVRGLKCPYCGHNETIEVTTDTVQERDWDEYLTKHAGEETTIEGRSTQVTCTGCGAVVLLQDQVATDRCPYCATHLENKPESAQSMIEPGGLLPFALTERDAIKAFDQWIASRWFAPSGLKRFANLGKLAGLYVPYWTFDSMTYTHYTGERGTDYTVSETYTETDAQGNRVTKTRLVTRTSWSYVSGNVDHFFDDVLIHASKSLPTGLVKKLEPWDLPALEDFKAQFLSGFQTERYTINLTDGFTKAREVMDAEIRRLCCRDIGGDHQRLHTVNTQHVGVTFKHVLLPIWLAAYRYHDKPYQVMINGRSGKVAGTRPYSWIKITLFVLLIIGLILGLLVLWARAADGSRRDVPPAPQMQRDEGRLGKNDRTGDWLGGWVAVKDGGGEVCREQESEVTAKLPLPLWERQGRRAGVMGHDLSQPLPPRWRIIDADPSPPTPLPQGARGDRRSAPALIRLCASSEWDFPSPFCTPIPS